MEEEAWLYLTFILFYFFLRHLNQYELMFILYLLFEDRSKLELVFQMFFKTYDLFLNQ